MDALYQTWRPRLLRFCAQMLRHTQDAEEVVQDVFAKLLTTKERYRLDAQPTPSTTITYATATVRRGKGGRG